MDLRKGVLLVLCTAIISGFSIFINSYGVKNIDSSVYTFLKNVIAAIFLLSAIFFFKEFNEIKKLNKKHWLQLVSIGFIGGSIPFLLFFKGLQMTTGKTSAFIHKTIFIYVAIFAILFLKEKLTKGLFLGALLLLIGNYLLIKPDFNFTIGHILIILATIFWAAENTIAKYALKEISGTIIGFGRMFFGSLFILIFLIFTNKLDILSAMTIEGYFWALLTGALLFFYVLSYYNGLKFIKVTTSACLLAIGSPITTLLDWIFKGTLITIYDSIGLVLIIIGVLSTLYFSQVYGYITRTFKGSDNEWH